MHAEDMILHNAAQSDGVEHLHGEHSEHDKLDSKGGVTLPFAEATCAQCFQTSALPYLRRHSS